VCIDLEMISDWSRTNFDRVSIKILIFLTRSEIVTKPIDIAIFF